MGWLCVYIYLYLNFQHLIFFLKKEPNLYFCWFLFRLLFLKIFKDHIRWVPAWKSGFLLEKHTPRAKQQENDETINY